MLHDKLGREIHDLRISVTDRCNFSCVYCKSADAKNYFPHRDLLTWEEFLRLSRVLVGLGIRKIRAVNLCCVRAWWISSRVSAILMVWRMWL
jgi:cyclic pyranopterin phosphate synthase